MTEITRVFVPFSADVIKTTVKTEDGIEVPARVLKGLMTDETLDLDGQVVDYEWAKKATPEWFAPWANIREQHSAKAVGKGKEVSFDDAAKSISLTSKVVDREAIVKIDEGVLSGYSVGIKGARIVKDASAPNGRIVGGKIIEVSVVDHPANENCKVALVTKAAKGTGPAPTEAIMPVEDEVLRKVAASDTGKLAGTDTEKKVDLPGDESQHNKPAQDVLDGLMKLLKQEVAEGASELGDVAWLAQIAQQFQSFLQSEAWQGQAGGGATVPYATYAAVADLTKAADEPDIEKRRRVFYSREQRAAAEQALQALRMALQSDEQGPVGIDVTDNPMTAQGSLTGTDAPDTSGRNTTSDGVPGDSNLNNDPELLRDGGGSVSQPDGVRDGKAGDEQVAKPKKKKGAVMAAKAAEADPESPASGPAPAPAAESTADAKKARKAARLRKQVTLVAELAKAIGAAAKTTDITKAATGDQPIDADMEALKAATADLVKGLRQQLEGEFDGVYAKAADVGEIRKDVEQLGAAPRPGGPHVGPASRTTEKLIAVNDAVEKRVPLEALKEIAEYEALTKSANRTLAASAEVALQELLGRYGMADEAV